MKIRPYVGGFGERKADYTCTTTGGVRHNSKRFIVSAEVTKW